MGSNDISDLKLNITSHHITSHLLESPSLSFRISSEETEESTQHMCTKLGDTAAELLQEHHTLLLQHRGSVNGLLGTGAP